MLKHQGVLSWYKKLPQTKENRFLGITKANKNLFQHLSIEEKCALRWLSHKKQIFKKKINIHQTFLSLNMKIFEMPGFISC